VHFYAKCVYQQNSKTCNMSEFICYILDLVVLGGCTCTARIPFGYALLEADDVFTFLRYLL